MDEIIEAFVDVVDGASVQDLVAFTGLSFDRCTEIIELYHKLLEGI